MATLHLFCAEGSFSICISVYKALSGGNLRLRIKWQCIDIWQLTFLQTTATYCIDMSTKCFISLWQYMFITSHSCQEAEGEGAVVGVRVNKAAKPATAVQNCVSAFVTVKPLALFRETLGKFPVCGIFDGKSGYVQPYLRRQNHVFERDFGPFPAVLVATKPWDFSVNFEHLPCLCWQNQEVLTQPQKYPSRVCIYQNRQFNCTMMFF